MPVEIPIRNLYFLLTYAWDALDEAELLDVDAAACPTPLDLLASVLAGGVDHVLRRGLDRGYVPRVEAVAGVRGKVDISASVKAMLLPRAKAVCEFDELTCDVHHNRVLKATLGGLLRCHQLDGELRDRVADNQRRLAEVGDIRLTDRSFRAIQLHRNNRFYKFLIDVCQLIHRCLLVDEATGEAAFRDFARDERLMRAMFEQFVRNFYRREQDVFRVRRQRFAWQRTTGAAADLAVLPMMTTDVSLISPDRHIVVETKFVPHALQSHMGKRSVRSGHLYQLFAYLANLAPTVKPGRRLEAVLLYPAAGGTSLDLRYEMHGRGVRVYTIDLGAAPESIRRDLLALLAETPPGQATVLQEAGDP